METQVGAIHGDLTGTVQIPADERDLEQIVPGQDTKLEGQFVQNHRRVHVGKVIGDVDCGL